MNENECVLVCVTVQKDCARLIHEGKALAEKKGLPLRVLHVSTGQNLLSSPDAASILNQLFSLAHESQAEMNILYESDVAAAIARYAQESGAVTLVLGPDRSGTASRVRPLLPPGVEMVRP